ncbi:MAG: MmgE/PrpD family protein [Candidatus Bathyarchaeota archaeon]|nr:MmgE/PrpD family protein [Candidatus Bathyarchaeota archaeon]
MPTIIQQLAQTTTNTNIKDITPHEQHQIKRIILDRIATATAAAQLNIHQELITHIQKTSTTQEATIWGTPGKVSHHHAALLNGVISAHLEYSPHNSMIPSLLALAETRKTTGQELLTALSAGYKIERIVNRLLASAVEKRGMHWPAYLSAFPATAASCLLLEHTTEQTANALSLVGCISPATPFEAFTQGTPAKDIYDGWGSYLGVLAAELGATGIGGPINLFEGERGLGKMWLDQAPTEEMIAYAFTPVKSSEVRHGIKAYPSCAAAHPTLTAVENLLETNTVNTEAIQSIEVTTYRFGADLSNSSTPDTPISAKVNIPILTAAMLKHKKIDPSYTEPPHLNDPETHALAKKITVKSLPDENDSVYGRSRFAEITITMKDGSKITSKADKTKWSAPEQASDKELVDKYRTLVADYLSTDQRDMLETKIITLETLTDVSEIVKLTLPHL